MVKESSGYNTNKIYLSFEDYIGLFNLLSKIVSIKTILETNDNVSRITHNQLRRIDCSEYIKNDNILESILEKIYNDNHKIRCYEMYRQFVNEDLMITVALCRIDKECRDEEYLHPTVHLERAIFADEYDHIYLCIDERMCSNSNFIEEINKVNNEEEIYSQDYHQNQFPISSRADYFNKMMDGIMAKVCRDCDKYAFDIIKKYNSVLSYTLYSDGNRFKDDEKKKINSAIDQIMTTVDTGSEYLLIADKDKVKSILESNFKN